ncbi:hypothetical protein DFH07DRAFT_834750 [Mycena maculata]|uniref:Prolyl 4-hydroxylase alpha subunit Fe(2+) 2OG dioxygenase domain-containing protein n=1 Tax=Mycena maculata TaxID=230809 RepID=A0AAD7IKZ3_9AGAR|nr:hypothetical protein DFH07DRAFT_834750 [Mycena maculata]
MSNTASSQRCRGMVCILCAVVDLIWSQTIWSTTVLPSHDSEEDIEQNLDVTESPIPMSAETETDWEHSDDEDEGEKKIDMPSTNIRGDFERVFNGPSDFRGSFYFHKTYIDFPNPTLRLGSLGTIGLPLSSREAKHVIAQCIQAPFGKGERTLVDKTVRDTWEMDASQVHFDNPAWATFMNRVTQDVCSRLGLAAQQSCTVRCEPYKLLLYETGSHFLPHQDTEKAKGMFATIVVVLPSPFQGGEAHLSHCTLSTIIDSSSRSLSEVSVMAWYTDVVHEIKPITGGYRLAIAFNLIQTANSRPELPQTNEYLSQLRHVLLSWKQADAANVPAKLIYLLQHKYSLASLRGDCLKGADAYKIGLLQSLAKELEFDVGLANVECHVVGAGVDDFGGRGCDSDEDSDDVEMGEVFEQNMSIHNLVTLDGRLLQDDVECEENDSEFCPPGLRDVVERGDPDERESEGYQGNGAGSLELWYRRTVLIIWPHRNNPDMEYRDDADGALTNMEIFNKESRLLARFLLRGLARDQFGPDIAQGLCDTACRWKSVSLWLKTVSVCENTKILDILSARRIVDAIEAFGFQKRLQDALGKILAEALSNKPRIKLLDSIMSRAGRDRVDNKWLARQRYRVMKTLKKPKLGEEELLVKLSVEGGSVPFLQSTILPQVVSMADPAFFVSFSTRLVLEQALLQSEEYIAATRSLVRDLLKLAIERTGFFVKTSDTVVHPTSDLAYLFIEACVKCSHSDLAELVIDKLVAFTADGARVQTFDVLLPLIPRLTASNRPIPGLVKLCHDTVEQYLKQPRTRPTNTELSAILDAVVGTKDATLLPKIVDHISTDVESCHSLIEHLRSRKESITFDKDTDGGGLSIASLCTQSVQNVVRKTQCGLSVPFAVIQLCISTDNSLLLGELFPRLLSPTVANKRYVDQVLLPLLPRVQAELAARNISPASEPFRALFKQVFELYASKVLGPKVADHSSLVRDVQKLNCPCVNCAAVVKFFLQTQQQQQLKLARIGATQRKHVERNLAQFCGYRIANWSTIGHGNSQGIEINKSNLLCSSIASSTHQTKLKQALDVVSEDERVLRQIFAEDYGKFLRSIGRSAELETGPPPKKRRMDDSADVIDLCSP